jgi:hypothetical protein
MLPWKRFRLDQAAFIIFAADARHRDQFNNVDGEGDDPGEGWELPEDWELDKVDRDGLVHVTDLVYYAVLEGVIRVPKGLELDLTIIPGEYGEHMYDWRVKFADYARFSLCLRYQREFKSLGWNEGPQPEGTAEQNAWWVLYEGVQEANRLLTGYRRWHGRLRSPGWRWRKLTDPVRFRYARWRRQRMLAARS